MIYPKIPQNEPQRLQEIENYQILYTDEDEDFNNIAKLAASICNTKIALINIVGKDVVWSKSSYGTDLKEVPRERSFCGHGINHPDSPFIVEDASQDERFFDNPYVIKAENGIKFYAGIPLVPKPDFCIGMLCVIDFEPKQLSNSQIEQLKLLAKQVIALLNLHKARREMITLNESYKKTNFLFQEAQKLSKLGAWELDLDTGETFWTDEVYAIHEVGKDFVHVLQNGIEFYHPEDRDTVIKNIQTSIETKKPSQFDARFTSAKGNSKYVRVTVNSYLEENGKKKLIGCIQDITKEKEIAYIEKLLKSFFDLSPIGIALNDFETGVFLDVNHKVVEPTGYTKEEFLALSYWDITPRKYQKYEEEALQQLKEKGRYGPYQKEYIRKDGTLYPVLLNGILVEDIFGKKRIWSVIEDISEKVAKEKMLRESKEKFETLVTNVPGVVYRYNYKMDWELAYISPYVETLCGYKVEELLHSQETYFHKLIVHEDFSTKLNAIQEALETSSSWEVEYKIKTKNGQIKWVYDKGKVIKNEQKGEVFLDGLMLEITEKIKLLEDLKETTLLADKANQAKSEFLANMSHEIRTPINGIIGFLELLRKTELNSIQQEYVNTIYNSSQSLLQIVSDILDFSKIESGKLELEYITTNLYELLEHSLMLVSLTAEQKGLDIILDISPDVPLNIYTDPTRLKQIFSNLLSNAVKFTNQGEIVFKVRFTPISDRVGNFYFEVKDTGIGIKEEQKEKLFKAFSQGDTSITRKFGGTGLGLVISNLIANKMQSQIKVESVYGQGSRFYFSLQTEYKFSEWENSNLTLIYYEPHLKRKTILIQYLQHWKTKIIEVDSVHAIKSVLNENPHVDTILVSLDTSQIHLLDFLYKLSSQISKPILLLCSYAVNEKLKQDNFFNLFRFVLNHPVSIQRFHSNLISIKKNSFPKSSSFQEGKLENTIFSKILVVEDNPTNLLLMKLLIKELFGDIPLHEARNGLEALQKTAEMNFDLILIDVQMPEMDGLEATKRIRQQTNHKNTVIIGITAGVLKEELANCIQAGMNAVLPKPINLESLRKTLLEFSSLMKSSFQEEKLPPSSHSLDNESFNKEALLTIVENDIESYLSLLESFLKLKEKFSLLDDLVKSKNFPQIQKIAHEIKGTSGNLFFQKLYSLSLDLEKKAKAENPEVEKSYKELAKEWNLIENFIIQELNSKNKSQQT